MNALPTPCNSLVQATNATLMRCALWVSDGSARTSAHNAWHFVALTSIRLHVTPPTPLRGQLRAASHARPVHTRTGRRTRLTSVSSASRAPTRTAQVRTRVVSAQLASTNKSAAPPLVRNAWREGIVMTRTSWAAASPHVPPALSTPTGGVARPTLASRALPALTIHHPAPPRQTHAGAAGGARTHLIQAKWNVPCAHPALSNPGRETHRA